MPREWAQGFDEVGVLTPRGIDEYEVQGNIALYTGSRPRDPWIPA